jgi:CheY-like chemotaxis protein
MPSQKILIVDDSKTIRMQVKDMLPKGNFEVLEAADGLEGLDVITQERPNLILLDFFMPRMNGWEVVQKLHDHPKLHVIPVVMMSGRREDVEKTVPELFTYFGLDSSHSLGLRQGQTTASVAYGQSRGNDRSLCPA